MKHMKESSESHGSHFHGRQDASERVSKQLERELGGLLVSRDALAAARRARAEVLERILRSRTLRTVQ
jgi:hypothetical protein